MKKLYHVKVELLSYIRANNAKKAVKAITKALPKMKNSKFHYQSVKAKKMIKYQSECEGRQRHVTRFGKSPIKAPRLSH